MALLRQSEAISDNRWQNLENMNQSINLKHGLRDASASKNTKKNVGQVGSM